MAEEVLHRLEAGHHAVGEEEADFEGAGRTEAVLLEAVEAATDADAAPREDEAVHEPDATTAHKYHAAASPMGANAATLYRKICRVSSKPME